jgi:hypothetical protein
LEDLISKSQGQDEDDLGDDYLYEHLHYQLKGIADGCNNASKYGQVDSLIHFSR